MNYRYCAFQRHRGVAADPTVLETRAKSRFEMVNPGHIEDKWDFVDSFSHKESKYLIRDLHGVLTTPPWDHP